MNVKIVATNDTLLHLKTRYPLNTTLQ